MKLFINGGQRHGEIIEVPGPALKHVEIDGQRYRRARPFPRLDDPLDVMWEYEAP